MDHVPIPPMSLFPTFFPPSHCVRGGTDVISSHLRRRYGPLVGGSAINTRAFRSFFDISTSLQPVLTQYRPPNSKVDNNILTSEWNPNVPNAVVLIHVAAPYLFDNEARGA